MPSKGFGVDKESFQVIFLRTILRIRALQFGAYTRAPHVFETAISQRARAIAMELRLRGVGSSIRPMKDCHSVVNFLGHQFRPTPKCELVVSRRP